MNKQILKNFYLKTIQFDMINKFPVKNTKDILKIRKVVLNFSYRTSEIKKLSTGLLALELLTSQKCVLTTTNRPNLEFKVRKGDPIGCKVTLRSNKMFGFLYTNLLNVFPQLKNFDGLGVPANNKLLQNSFTYTISDTFSFAEIEKNYQLFQNLPDLRITIVIKSSQNNQFLFVLKSLKTPFKINSMQI